jgi:polar amino acid transport system substrate-binding protein
VAGLYLYSPFYEEAPERRGLDLDMLQELERRSGCELRSVVESRLRIWDQMRRGVLQLTLSSVITPERREVAEIHPYLQVRFQLMLQGPATAGVATLADFEARPGLHLLGVRGYAYGPTFAPWAQRLREQGRLVEASDFQTAVRMFRAGRADGLIVAPAVITEVQAAYRGSAPPRVVDPAPHERLLVGMALSLAMPEGDRQRLRQALAAMRQDGTLQALVTRHFGEYGVRMMLPRGE